MELRNARLAVVVVTLTAVAGLVAHGTTRLIASALLAAAPRALVPAAPESTPAPADPCALLARPVLFGASLQVSCEAPPPTPPPRVETDLSAAAPCSTALRLVGAVVPRDASSASFAAITDASGASLLYTEGMRVGDERIAAIDRHEVILARDDGSACVLSMFERPSARTASLVPIDPAPPSATLVQYGGEDEIQSTGPSSFSVPRALVDRLASSGELLTTLRAVPHQGPNGTVDGYRVFGVRAESVSARLGLANGDLVTRVNERAIDGVGAAMDALVEVSHRSQLTIGLVRRGQPLTLTYDVR